MSCIRFSSLEEIVISKYSAGSVPMRFPTVCRMATTDGFGTVDSEILCVIGDRRSTKLSRASRRRVDEEGPFSRSSPSRSPDDGNIRPQNALHTNLRPRPRPLRLCWGAAVLLANSLSAPLKLLAPFEVAGPRSDSLHRVHRAPGACTPNIRILCTRISTVQLAPRCASAPNTGGISVEPEDPNRNSQGRTRVVFARQPRSLGYV